MTLTLLEVVFRCELGTSSKSGICARPVQSDASAGRGEGFGFGGFLLYNVHSVIVFLDWLPRLDSITRPYFIEMFILYSTLLRYEPPY